MQAWLSCVPEGTAACTVLGISAGVFSLFLAAAPFLGELGLTSGGGVSGAEDGPAVASSAVMRLLRSLSIGVLGGCLGAAPACQASAVRLASDIHCCTSSLWPASMYNQKLNCTYHIKHCILFICEHCRWQV